MENKILKDLLFELNGFLLRPLSPSASCRAVQVSETPEAVTPKSAGLLRRPFLSRRRNSNCVFNLKLQISQYIFNFNYENTFLTLIVAPHPRQTAGAAMIVSRRLRLRLPPAGIPVVASLRSFQGTSPCLISLKVYLGFI